MSKKSFVIILIFSVFFIISLVGFLLFNLNRENNNNSEIADSKTIENSVSNPPENIVIPGTVFTSSNPVKISPNCSILFLKHYTKCGHTTRERTNVDSDMVNLSEEDFRNQYSDWQITKFTSSDIELEKNFPSSCGEHYLVKPENGYITIYSIKEDNSLEVVEKTEIAVKYLSLEDMNELENGVVLYGKENLNSYIENFE